MNDEAFNMSIRRFLKVVGIRSQTEIERAVAKALADGRIKGDAVPPATMRLAGRTASPLMRSCRPACA